MFFVKNIFAVFPTPQNLTRSSLQCYYLPFLYNIAPGIHGTPRDNGHRKNITNLWGNAILYTIPNCLRLKLCR